MLNRIKNDARGFTLVELLVVILILGILLAIALPSFLNAQNSAKDADAKTRLNTAYKVAKAYAAQHEGFTYVYENNVDGFGTDDIIASEGSDLGIQVWTADGQNLDIRTASASGKTCTLTVTNGVVSGPSCA